jgi:DNA-binding NarL/FixJ family response regulator
MAMVKNHLSSARSTPVRHRIFLIGDHSIMREGLRRLLEAETDLVVGGEASTAKQALAAIAAELPELVLVDIGLPGADGIELIKTLRARFPALLMLVLSMHDEALYAERVLRAGAKGYVMKSSSSEQLLQAVRKVLAGEIFVSPSLSSQMLQSMVKGKSQAMGTLAQLSDRELEIVQLIGQGLSTSEISGRLGISSKTVESHRGNIRAKLSLKSGAELARFSIANASGVPDSRGA